jgi:hypothetical protein
MATAFETAARDLFDDENLSRAAIYTPPVGDTVDCRIIFDVAHSTPQSGGLPVMSTKGRALRVLASVVTPEKNGVFTVGDEAHKVQGDPVLTGPNRLAWRCQTREIEVT